MSAQEEYFELIKKNELINVLDAVDIGYSNKLNLVKKLLENYSNKEINHSLNIYQNKYVSIGKFNLPYLYNTLSGIIIRDREKIK